MYSPSFGKNVLIDFNCSSVISEKVGEKTLTMFKGTRLNCSEEMEALKNEARREKERAVGEAGQGRDALRRREYGQVGHQQTGAGRFGLCTPGARDLPAPDSLRKFAHGLRSAPA